MSRPVDYKQLGAEAVEAVGLPLVDNSDIGVQDFGFVVSLHLNMALRINGTKRGDYTNDARAKKTGAIAALAHELDEKISKYHGREGEFRDPTKALDEMVSYELIEALRKIEKHYSHISRFSRHCADINDSDLTEYCVNLAQTFHTYFGIIPGISRNGPFIRFKDFTSKETGLTISDDTAQEAARRYKGHLAL